MQSVFCSGHLNSLRAYCLSIMGMHGVQMHNVCRVNKSLHSFPMAKAMVYLEGNIELAIWKHVPCGSSQIDTLHPLGKIAGKHYYNKWRRRHWRTKEQ